MRFPSGQFTDPSRTVLDTSAIWTCQTAHTSSAGLLLHARQQNKPRAFQMALFHQTWWSQETAAVTCTVPISVTGNLGLAFRTGFAIRHPSELATADLMTSGTELLRPRRT